MKPDVSAAPLSSSASLTVQEMLQREAKLITPNRIFYLVIAIAFLIFSGIQSDISIVELIQGGGNMSEYISRYFPPRFHRLADVPGRYGRNDLHGVMGHVVGGDRQRPPRHSGL